jgi:hypothetical protein
VACGDTAQHRAGLRNLPLHRRAGGNDGERANSYPIYQNYQQ